MKMISLWRMLSLLMISIIVLTSMSECKQGDVPLVEYTKYSPVNADINGVSFTSGDYTYLAWGGNPFSFMKYDEGFGFGITRDIVYGDDEVTIHISIREDGTSSYILSGYFEFTAVDSEKDLTITVTNGTFENIWT